MSLMSTFIKKSANISMRFYKSTNPAGRFKGIDKYNPQLLPDELALEATICWQWLPSSGTSSSSRNRFFTYPALWEVLENGWQCGRLINEPKNLQQSGSLIFLSLPPSSVFSIRTLPQKGYRSGLQGGAGMGNVQCRWESQLWGEFLDAKFMW